MSHCDVTIVYDVIADGCCGSNWRCCMDLFPVQARRRYLMGDSEIISSAACSLVGGLPALSSDHRGFSVLDSAFQDPSTSDQFTRVLQDIPIQ